VTRKLSKTFLKQVLLKGSVFVY